MHHHVQAVTVLEATHPENNPDHKSSTIKRNVYKDNNNNVQQITKTKESLNVAATTKKTSSSEESTEYTLLGLVTFKSPIKWLNTISIILIHLILVFGFFTYPLHTCIRTTLWGEFKEILKCLVIITRRTYSRKKHDYFLGTSF